MFTGVYNIICLPMVNSPFLLTGRKQQIMSIFENNTLCLTQKALQLASNPSYMNNSERLYYSSPHLQLQSIKSYSWKKFPGLILTSVGSMSSECLLRQYARQIKYKMSSTSTPSSSFNPCSWNGIEFIESQRGVTCMSLLRQVFFKG